MVLILWLIAECTKSVRAATVTSVGGLPVLQMGRHALFINKWTLSLNKRNWRSYSFGSSRHWVCSLITWESSPWLTRDELVARGRSLNYRHRRVRRGFWRNVTNRRRGEVGRSERLTERLAHGRRSSRFTQVNKELRRVPPLDCVSLQPRYGLRFALFLAHKLPETDYRL